MNFHPHPPLQTFAETTCGCERISWKAYACLPACPCVCVSEAFGKKTAMTFHYHLFMRVVVYFVLGCAAPLVNTNLKPGRKQEYVLTRVIITVTPALLPA